MDEIEEYWAELRPPPLPRPPPTDVVPGYVWMGLLLGDKEIQGIEGYARQRVFVPYGHRMEFRAGFPVERGFQVTGISLYVREHGNEVLWQKVIDPIVLTKGMSFDVSLVVTDVPTDITPFVGFRKVLQLHGVL